MPNRYGITPLHLAVVLGHVELAHMLISVGADVNFRDQLAKSTPLALALSTYVEGEEVDKMCALIIRLGRNVNPFKPDRRSLDSVMLATMKNNKSLFEAVLKLAKSSDFTKDNEYDKTKKATPY